MTVVVQELGIWQTSRYVDLEMGRSDNAKVFFEIPTWAEPGEYDARITISNDDIRRVRHREFVVV